MQKESMMTCIDYIKSRGREQWTKVSYDTLWHYILLGAEEEYARFSSKLLPDYDSDRVKGIRIPILRRYAQFIAKGHIESFLAIAQSQAIHANISLEESLLRGFVIGQIKDWEIAKRHITDFIPYIDNWSLNDTFCAGLKIAKQEPEHMYEFILPYLESRQVYKVRFALVMLLDYYIKQEYIWDIFDACDRITMKEYYVQMAIAWTLSMCYVFYPHETISYLSECKLDRFTYNKAIQKMIESRQVKKEEKEMLKSLKRV